jgi:hypothetical protein
MVSGVVYRPYVRIGSNRLYIFYEVAFLKNVNCPFRPITLFPIIKLGFSGVSPSPN